MADCSLCGGVCAGADLASLLHPTLARFWEQVAAAADRRGDASLAAGTLSIRAPDLPEERAAVMGMIGGGVLTAGQRRRVDLAALTATVRIRGSELTPGAVAAHATGRALAHKSKVDAERVRLEDRLFQLFRDGLPTAIYPDAPALWTALRRGGWIARIGSQSDPAWLIRSAVAIMNRLPAEGLRIDRRLLASDVTRNPHGLDNGQILASFVLATLVAAGRIRPRQRPRLAWSEVGVDCDDIVGGLVAVGIAPLGWTVPTGMPVTLPPRALRSCSWPGPTGGAQWVFVTENPSIAAGAAELAATACPLVRILCTIGTPSSCEIEAIARLAAVGWHIAVRADFDAAGLHHVGALLAGVPQAVPWRMSTVDYLASISAGSDLSERIDVMNLPRTPWDEGLAQAMTERGVATFEEALAGELMSDLRVGAPGDRGHG